ncbi:MAG: DMT family transporter [Rhodospirillales bacterium]|jgi:drug/metabolite transporter (DMT)-like permease|nr:DMT family transporter [Rhodospirillales bacterium]
MGHIRSATYRLIARPSAARGMILVLIAALASAAMNVCVRHVAAEMHPFQAAFFRSLFGLLLLLPLILRHGLGHLRTPRPVLHSIRGAIQAAVILLAFTGLSMVPVAKVTALQFTMPLFAALMAIAFLGEPVHARRVVALVVGFAGALIIVRPGLVPLNVGSVLVLLSAAGVATLVIIIKLLGRTDSSLTITFYMGVFTTPVTLLFAVPVWRSPSLAELGWLVVIGALTIVINFCFAQAVKEADATTLMPFDFTKLIWAALLGYLAFGEVPEVWTWVGGAVIFAAAAGLTFSERSRV